MLDRRLPTRSGASELDGSDNCVHFVTRTRKCRSLGADLLTEARYPPTYPLCLGISSADSIGICGAFAGKCAMPADGPVRDIHRSGLVAQLRTLALGRLCLGMHGERPGAETRHARGANAASGRRSPPASSPRGDPPGDRQKPRGSCLVELHADSYVARGFAGNSADLVDPRQSAR